MKKTVKKIWNTVTTILVVLAVVLAVLLVGVRLFGLQVFTVLSGSMEPAYHVGSLIYVKKTDPLTLKTGDAITFLLDEETVVTHRIVDVVPDENDPGVVRFRTKGDANRYEDGSLVHCRNVIGRPVFTIPGLGYVTAYMQQPPGLYITIAAVAVILLLAFVPDMLDEDRKAAGKKAGEKRTGKKAPREAKPIPDRPAAPRHGRKPAPDGKAPPPRGQALPRKEIPASPAGEESGAYSLEDILREWK